MLPSVANLMTLLHDNKLTVISFVIVVAVSLWWYFRRPTSLRAQAQAELVKSNGTLDVHAQEALRVLDAIEQPTAQDKFMTARVIDLNGHEGRINNVRVLDDVVSRYMYNLVDDDGLDWFEIDQIENFTERHQDILFTDPRYETFRNTVQKQRPKMLQVTVEEAKESSGNRAEAFSTYVEGSVNHTNDPQNVHDSAVNEQLRTSYMKLQKTTPPDALKKAQSEIPSAVRRHLSKVENVEQRARAENALNKILEGRHNSTVDANERDLLTLVWARSCMNENFSNKGLMRDAVVEALRDMGDEGTEGGVVCSGGRCARLLESLLFTDQDDKVVAGVMTTEQIRNDVLERSNKLLNSTIEEFTQKKKNEDPGMAQVAESYLDPSVTPSPEDEKRFKAVVKAKIHTLINNDYADKLSDRDLTNIRAHCLAAIESI